MWLFIAVLGIWTRTKHQRRSAPVMKVVVLQMILRGKVHCIPSCFEETRICSCSPLVAQTVAHWSLIFVERSYHSPTVLEYITAVTVREGNSNVRSVGNASHDRLLWQNTRALTLARSQCNAMSVRSASPRRDFLQRICARTEATSRTSVTCAESASHRNEVSKHTYVSTWSQAIQTTRNILHYLCSWSRCSLHAHKL